MNKPAFGLFMPFPHVPKEFHGLSMISGIGAMVVIVSTNKKIAVTVGEFLTVGLALPILCFFFVN